MGHEVVTLFAVAGIESSLLERAFPALIVLAVAQFIGVVAVLVRSVFGQKQLAENFRAFKAEEFPVAMEAIRGQVASVQSQVATMQRDLSAVSNKVAHIEGVLDRR